ncbi:hypothetical protein SLE2022_323570 [Rubroshorea leprosula]
MASLRACACRTPTTQVHLLQGRFTSQACVGQFHNWGGRAETSPAHITQGPRPYVRRRALQQHQPTLHKRGAVRKHHPPPPFGSAPQAMPNQHWARGAVPSLTRAHHYGKQAGRQAGVWSSHQPINPSQQQFREQGRSSKKGELFYSSAD